LRGAIIRALYRLGKAIRIGNMEARKADINTCKKEGWRKFKKIEGLKEMFVQLSCFFFRPLVLSYS
jgi:hypothetical protein